MPNWCYCEIEINTSGIMTGDDLMMLLRERSQNPQRSFSLTSCVPEPHDLSDEADGPNGWCDWRIANWGTKWDICSGEVDEPRVSCWADEVSISGDTAWAPPLPAFDALAASFPGISIALGWLEPNWPARGYVRWKGGCRSLDWSEDIADETHDADSAECLCQLCQSEIPDDSWFGPDGEILADRRGGRRDEAPTMDMDRILLKYFVWK
jgi:hypothetical protein